MYPTNGTLKMDHDQGSCSSWCHEGLYEGGLQTEAGTGMGDDINNDYPSGSDEE